MNRKITFFCLLIIFLIAGYMRLYHLGNVPPSPDWDEAALGYNAYSIIETGRDEYGKSFPIVLRSFDDYKPALYAYLIIPFIKLFDLNVLAVRLPSALLGILTVLTTYFFVLELFRNWKPESGNGKWVALVSSFLLAISPWHIQFSRIGFESNVAVAFNVFGALFLMKGLRKPKFLLLGIFFPILGIYTYQSAKVFVPLLLLSFLIVFFKKIITIPKKYILGALILLFVMSLPMAMYMFKDKESLSRAKGVVIYSDITPFLKENVIRIMEDKKNKDFIGLILDNRRFVFGKAIVSGYLSHFDLNWLFIRGDIARHHAPGMGLLYLFELPFLLLGMYYLIFSSIERKIKIFLLSWFLLAPLPASITSGVPHAVRTLNFLPTFQVFTAIGIFLAFSFFSRYKFRFVRIFFYGLFIVIFSGNIFYYTNQYFVQQNYFNSQDWQYGYKETVSEVAKIENKYNKIIVSNIPYLDQSYMFFLFYLKYDPELYQRQKRDSAGGFRENHYFGKFEFRPIDWTSEERTNNLYIGKPDNFPVGASTVRDIYFLDGKPAIKIVKG